MENLMYILSEAIMSQYHILICSYMVDFIEQCLTRLVTIDHFL